MNGSRLSLREAYEEREKEHLETRATLSSESKYTQRVHEYQPDDVRAEFHRDYTRILHSRAFRRLRHKTQVFISPKNDHICTRMEHSLHVASVARTIARALCLNEDLVAAIAVGHDLGHAPFGHLGEKSLNCVAKKHGLEFTHELHSLRVVDVLESPYAEHNGLNLTFGVRDGIVCHYGEGIANKFEKTLSPDRNKQPHDLKSTKRGASRPATLEGCVVRWADKVAYLGRDLEDALDPEVHLISEKDIPQSVQDVLGTSNKEIIAKLVSELIASGSDEDGLSISEKVHDALNDLYAFNMERIYLSEAATKAREQIDRSMELMFDSLLVRLRDMKSDPEAPAVTRENPRVLKVFADFLSKDIRGLDEHPEKQLVIDYIAGMTDSFFRDSVVQLLLPSGTV